MSGKVTHGANVEELDDIAVGLRRQGEKVADVGGRGSMQLEKLRAVWDGPDFEKFAKDWRIAHRVIDDAETALRTFSRTLAAESEQQRQSSGVSHGEFARAPLGGGSSSGGSGPALGGAPVDPGDGPTLGGKPVEPPPEYELGDGNAGPDFRQPLEGGPAFPDEPIVRGPLEGGPAYPDDPIVRGPLEGGPAPFDDGPAFERVETQPAFERVETQPARGSMLAVDNMMAVLPDLPGAEEVGLDEPAQAFERMDPSGQAFERSDVPAESPAAGAMERSPAGFEPPTDLAPAEGPSPEASATEAMERSPLEAGPATATPEPSGDSPSAAGTTTPAEAPAAPMEAPTQVPTGDGAHVTTAPDSAGERSAAFDPRGLSEANLVDGSSIGEWLGLDELRVLPWRS